jgi:hypothetical protein
VLVFLADLVVALIAREGSALLALTMAP